MFKSLKDYIYSKNYLYIVQNKVRIWSLQDILNSKNHGINTLQMKEIDESIGIDIVNMPKI